MFHHLPCFYYPTSLILIDDNLDFLNSLKLALASHYHCLPFQAPQEALRFLQQHASQHHHFNISVQLDDQNSVYGGINLTPIMQQVFNPHRFEQVAICLIDYDMPGMNGLALAKQLKSVLPVKIIMLTGEADHTIAVNALNQKMIDAFILKSDPDYLQQLLTFVTQLHHDYFATQTATTIGTLALQSSHPIQDADFIDLFEHICQQQKIVEYYLVDESGSFLMLDTERKIHWLLIKTEEDLETLAELAEHDGLPKLAQELLAHEVIACYPTLEDITASAQTWKIYPAKQLHDKPVYYALLHQGQGYKLDEKIVGYRDFLLSR